MSSAIVNSASTTSTPPGKSLLFDRRYVWVYKFMTQVMEQLSDPSDAAIEFFACLDYQLNKVNQFFKAKEREFLERGESLKKQMEILIELKAAVKKKQAKGHFCQDSKEEDSISGTISCVIQKLQFVQESGNFADLVMNLNMLAFVKILKKFDKMTNKQVLPTYLRVVESSYFNSSDKTVSNVVEEKAKWIFDKLKGLKASEAFFSAFISSVFNDPMIFFDSTPVGRILTPASSVLSVLDFDIPLGFSFLMAALTEVLATIGIMASVTWQVLFLGIFAMGYYQKSAGELMRINGTTKTLVMNYASETALGVATIRAFGVVHHFSSNYLKLVNTDAKVFLSSNATLEWLVLRTEALHNLTLFTTAVFLVLIPNTYIAPGLVGLSLSYAFALTGTKVFLSRWYSSLANYIISVERIKQYMHIPPEPPAIVEDNRPPTSWPQKGTIELWDLKQVWDEVGETDEERDKMLLRLEQECLDVYKRKVDHAVKSRAQLIQTLENARVELTNLLSALGEKSYVGIPEQEQLKCSLKL
ncbi:ABC transporter c family member 8 [Phtheirospermum japonicum]|uniref:ABC transporter c family member 8 n=1 Tax=Phtheirospermum japonicum TaxID=374723 RepID=A0A830D2G3_9LAMI|nr:ABC transporter c family member 8 [Phtheirospermum japonicum]